MSNRLNLLLRKNKGKTLILEYVHTFTQVGIDISKLEHIGLEQCEQIYEGQRGRVSLNKWQSEWINADDTHYTSSQLISKYLQESPKEDVYVYLGDHEYCGMYKMPFATALTHCLILAKLDSKHSCDIASVNLDYGFQVDFYDQDDSWHPNLINIKFYTSV